MVKLSIAGALLSVSLVAAVGCDASETSDVELDNSALTGAGGGGAVTVDSPIRGYSVVAAQIERHAVVYRTAPNGTVHRRLYTPLSSATSLGGSLAPGSAPWGYRRADGVDAVLYIDTNRHVHEITSAGDFDYHLPPLLAPLAAAAPANGPVPDVIGYVRSDNRSAVVYKDSEGHVIELLSNAGGNPAWVTSDLTVIAGAQVTANKGSVFPYVRSDTYNAIVYIGSDNHIHELSNFGTTYWGDGDLSGASGSTSVAPATDPWGYARSDGYNCVVFVGSDGLMHELAYYPNTWWGSWVLPAVSPQTGPTMRPSAYVRADGFNTVVYLGSDARVHEIHLASFGWSDSAISTGNAVPTGQLFGHRHPEAKGSILFRGTNAGVVHGYELSLPASGGWTLQEL